MHGSGIVSLTGAISNRNPLLLHIRITSLFSRRFCFQRFSFFPIRTASPYYKVYFVCRELFQHDFLVICYKIRRAHVGCYGYSNPNISAIITMDPPSYSTKPPFSRAGHYRRSSRTSLAGSKIFVYLLYSRAHSYCRRNLFQRNTPKLF